MRLTESDRMVAGIYWTANAAYVVAIARRRHVPRQDLDDVLQAAAVFFLRRSAGKLWLTKRVLRLSALDAIREYYTQTRKRKGDLKPVSVS